jgi:two-component system NtrC family response regulator
LKYGWPGNIRELENIIQKAIISSESSLISNSDLAIFNSSEDHTKLSHLSLKEARNNAEKQAIIQALTITHGNISSASTLLEIDRKWLMKKMDELGIEADKYRK